MTFDQALSRASALCAQSEKCVSEIRDKLIGWGIMGDDLDRLLETLIAQGFIDEARYAQAFVNDKFRFQHWGRVKIRFSLRSREIDDALISQALEEKIDDDAYQEACDAVVADKLRGLKQPLSQADRARIFRFAAQRGFEAGCISRSLRNLQCGDDDD